MNPTNAKVRKTIIGKHEVTYDCPECGASLKNDLDDAGKDDTCPHCDCQFKVPGATFKAKLEKEKAEKEAEKAEQERQKEAEKKAAREAERLKAEELTRRSAVLTSQIAADDEADRIIVKNSIFPINYISMGLMYLVRALLLFISMLLFLLGGQIAGAFAIVFALSGYASATVFIVLIWFAVVIIPGVMSFISLIQAMDCFSKGAKPR